MTLLIKRTMCALVCTATVLAWPAASWAQQRGNVVIKGPGFSLERRNGWFGTQQNVYSDIFGNRISQKQGLFGRRTEEGQVLGTNIQRNGRTTSLKDPNGNVIIQRKRGWFGGEDTTINTDGVLQKMKGVFGNAPNNSNPGTGN
jgi:hypothetical protein